MTSGPLGVTYSRACIGMLGACRLSRAYMVVIIQGARVYGYLGRVIIQAASSLDDHNGGPYLYYNYNPSTLHPHGGKDKFTSRSLIFRNGAQGCSINTEIDWDK